MNPECKNGDLPKGTVTFLFTDIEGSTELLDRLHEQYQVLLEKHRAILRATFAKWKGHEVDSRGDEFFLSFPHVMDAVHAAIEAQRNLIEQDWPEGEEVRVRMGLHTGEPWLAESGYVGMDVHRAARIGNLGSGGQVLLSNATASIIQEELMKGVDLLELGEYRLKGIPRPERIYQLAIDGLPSEFPPLRSPDAGLPPHNLPSQPTTFVGRGPELETLEAMIADPDVRLISIVAAGGMGKTRIALACSEKQVSITERMDGKLEFRFPYGVYFVSLAPLESPGGILPAIAEALDFQILGAEDKGIGAGGETRTPKKQLLDYLQSKRLLLVMDNFEHLLEGAGLLTEIMGAAPEIKILVTSRERLNLKGEHLFPLLGMRFPDLEKLKASEKMDHGVYSALALFEQSAHRIKPDFQIAQDDFVDVVSICRLVGGMPLGIELAAAWVNMLTLKEITQEIQRSLDFLEAELRDVDERHRSIRAVFDSTWDRLNEEEQELFEKLTVFQGGFTREAAEEVARASLNSIGALINKSLLQYDQGRGRFILHELLRQFGAERLAEDDEKEQSCRDGHSTYYCNLLNQLEPLLKGSRYVEAMDEVEADFENVTTAWRWAAEQSQFYLLSLAMDPLDFYCVNSGRRVEGEGAFSYALEILPESQCIEDLRLRVRLKTLVARYIPLSKRDKKEVLIEENWDLLRSPPLAQEDTRLEEADLMTLLGDIMGDPKEASRHYQKAYELYESLGERLSMAFRLADMGDHAQNLAILDEAVPLQEKSLVIFREIGFKKGVAQRLNMLSSVMLNRGELEQADRFLNESVKIFEELNDQRSLGWTFLFVGLLKSRQGIFTDAYRLFNESIDISQEYGLTGELILANLFQIWTEGHLGRYQDAIARAYTTNKHPALEYSNWHKGYVKEHYGFALMGVGDFENGIEILQESFKIYRTHRFNREIAFGIPYLMICMHGLGEVVKLKELVHEALQIYTKIRFPYAIIEAFAAFALLQLVEGRVEQAIEYYAYAASYPYIANSHWYKDLVACHIEKAAESLPPEVVAAAQDRGRKLDPEKVIQELLFEMEAKDDNGKNG